MSSPANHQMNSSHICADNWNWVDKPNNHQYLCKVCGREASKEEHERELEKEVSEATDSYTGSCTSSHLESQGSQPYESSFLGTSSPLGHLPSSATYVKSMTPQSTVHSLSGESSLCLEREKEELIGTPSSWRLNHAKLNQSPVTRTLVSTIASSPLGEITSNQSKDQEWWLRSSGALQVRANQPGLGRRRGWMHSPKTPCPSFGMGTKENPILLSTSSEGVLTSPTSCDGSTNIPATSRLKVHQWLSRRDHSG